MKMSFIQLVSPLTRLVASEPNAIYLPSGESEWGEEALLPWIPLEFTEHQHRCPQHLVANKHIPYSPTCPSVSVDAGESKTIYLPSAGDGWTIRTPVPGCSGGRLRGLQHRPLQPVPNEDIHFGVVIRENQVAGGRCKRHMVSVCWRWKVLLNHCSPPPRLWRQRHGWCSLSIGHAQIHQTRCSYHRLPGWSQRKRTLHTCRPPISMKFLNPHLPERRQN